MSASSSETILITAGGTHSCAIVDIISEVQSLCWGSDLSGQLGRTAGGAYPSEIDGGYNFTHISAGNDHTCAIADGVAYCWGQNVWDQLGHSESTTTAPTAVSGSATGWTTIAAGATHSCGIADGTLYCWGSNLVGQLGRSGAGGATPTAVDWEFAR